jgi:predicted double-glycine peptidase
MSAPKVDRGPSPRSVAILAFVAWLLAAGAVGAADATVRPRLLPLPDVRQHAVYACGAGALQAVLAYYGIDARQDALMAELGTDEEIGTRWWEIVRLAGEKGLEAEAREGMSADELRAELDRGVPVLLAIQAWADPSPADPVGWAGRTEDGHYVVAVGHDAERFYFEDPAMFGVGYIPRAELEARWHDYDEFGTRLERFGIAFRRPAGPDALAVHLIPIE